MSCRNTVGEDFTFGVEVPHTYLFLSIRFNITFFIFRKSRIFNTMKLLCLENVKKMFFKSSLRFFCAPLQLTFASLSFQMMYTLELRQACPSPLNSGLNLPGVLLSHWENGIIRFSNRIFPNGLIGMRKG